MKKNILFGLLLMISSTLMAATPAESIRQLHRAGETYSASFVETKQMPKLKKTIHKNGKLAFRSPEYLRLDYTNPQGEYTLLDKDLFEVSREGKVQHFSVKNEKGRMAIFRKSLLLAFAGDIDGVAALNEAKATCVAKGNTWVCTIAGDDDKSKKRDIAELTLVYDKKTGALLSATIVEGNGNYTTYEVAK